MTLTTKRTNLINSFIGVRELFTILSTVVVLVWWVTSTFQTKADAEKAQDLQREDLRLEVSARQNLANDISSVRSDVSYIRGTIEAKAAKTK